MVLVDWWEVGGAGGRMGVGGREGNGGTYDQVTSPVMAYMTTSEKNA